MSKIILVMGLPTSGKTFLSLELTKILNAYWLNNDNVRKDTGDWDFSLEGRLRQAKRMSILSNEKKKTGKIVVADFICPTRETRKIFNPDYIVWMNTIKKSLHEDTNLLFEPPLNEKIHFIVKEKNAEFYSKKIAEHFKKIFLI